MCDLIDLNSPDRNTLLGPKLALPLIPPPVDSSSNDRIGCLSPSSSLMIGKRESLENNPFDMVLHKTTEYIQKKDDPFEVALEKALNAKQKNVTLRTGSVDLTDCTTECKRPGRITRMNQTLDETTINKEINSDKYWKNIPFSTIRNQSIIRDSNNINITDGNLKSDNLNLFPMNSNNIPNIKIHDADLSILNQSALNDTLLEMSYQAEENQVGSVLEQRKSNYSEMKTIDKDQGIQSIVTVSKLRRSFSYDGKLSPHKAEHLRSVSLSTMGSLTTGSINRGSLNSVRSTNSVDLLNEGFWNSHSRKSSVFSTLSNVSTIPQLSSVSSATDLLLMQSDSTVNRTFLESCLSENTVDTRLSNRVDSVNETNCMYSMLVNSRLTPQMTNKQQNASIKLIDVDVFTPEANGSKEECRSSTSGSSSDSVFLEGSKINNSILCEAKAVARRFEELALRSSSGSSCDDLITSNPLWTSELLPAFDEEDMVGNLIELPTSPNTTSDNAKLPNKPDADGIARTKDNENCADNNKEQCNIIKDLETELIEPIAMEKKITATTLLLDLKKLIRTENNTAANKLLENLEKVLGVEFKNNTELLTTYLNTTNNLSKSPKKINDNLEIKKNVEEAVMEESKEENLITEHINEPAFCEDINLNNTNRSKCSENNEKCLDTINRESVNISSETDTNSDTSNEKSDTDTNPKVNTASTSEDQSNSVSKTENDWSNEKLAMELLTNLGKLLNGQIEEQSTADLLRNLGKVLTFASNNASFDLDNKTKTDNNHVAIQQTPKKSKLQPENKIHTSLLSKSINRLSLDLEAKKQSSTTKLLRRSASVSQTLPLKIAPNSLMSKRKCTSQLKEIKKRFSSDPGFINSISSNKDINLDLDGSKIDNTGKDERTKTNSVTVDVQKEKPVIEVGAVKSKLKKKTDATNKRGPMKAILPIGNMQRIESFSKKVSPTSGIVTPPMSHKIISSTPNSMDNECATKRSPRSKPVASSTPDFQNSKARKAQSQLPDYSKKRTFSCDISPVTVHMNGGHKNGVKNSPKKTNKLPSPKKTTPKRRPADSSIPKSQTPPVSKKMSSSFEYNQCNRIPLSPQRSLYNKSNSRKSSPIPIKKKGEKMLQSPLRDSNKLSPKVKPFNLITKLRRHSVDTNTMEKENTYV